LRLKIHGLVEHELSLSLQEVRTLPARTQITRHDCVEGWSCIAKWTGPPLASCCHVLASSLRPALSYSIVPTPWDDGGDSGADPESIRYYESIDLIDASTRRRSSPMR